MIARQGDDGGWEPVVPARQLDNAWRAPVAEGQAGEALARLWQRIWMPDGGLLEMN